MGNPAGIKRNFDAWEKRRLKAFKLLSADVPQAEVARHAGVHRQSVSRWTQAARFKGKATLLKAGRAGRLPRLSLKQKEQIRTVLVCRAVKEATSSPTRKTAQLTMQGRELLAKPLANILDE